MYRILHGLYSARGTDTKAFINYRHIHTYTRLAWNCKDPYPRRHQTSFASSDVNRISTEAFMYRAPSVAPFRTH